MSMQAFAFYTLSGAVLLGLVLAQFYLRSRPSPSPLLGAVHGILGVMGIGILAFALRGPVHASANGVGPFEKIAAILMAAAAVIGLVVLVLPQLSNRGAGWAIGAHATVAIAGYVFLLAFMALR
jgi:hypothetical protein